MIPHSKPWICEDDQQAVAAQLRTGMIAQGEEARAFEADVAAYLEAPDAVAFASGTAALVAALRSLNVGPDDEVILPTYVCRSVRQAVEAVGATPVLCDVGPRWTITPATVAPHVTPRTRAIIVVHTFGIVVEVEAFRRFGVPIVEDCCQAFGARCDGTPVGLMGDAGVYSFHATKCLTTGEGGMLVTRDEDLAQRARRLRDERRLPAPLTDLQAALGRSQLARYPQMLARRRAIADRYFDALPSRFTERLREVEDRSIFYRFPLAVSGDFDELRGTCEARGVAVRRGVDALLHRQRHLSDDGFGHAVVTFGRTLSIPIYPALSDDDVTRVIDMVSQEIS